jgi:hypothetical protein
MAFNIDEMAASMSLAALNVLQDKYPRTFAEAEFRKLGETIVAIDTAKLRGEVNEEEAKLLFNMQTDSMRAVLLAVEGIGMIQAEQAINEALAVVRDAINAAVGWRLV